MSALSLAAELSRGAPDPADAARRLERIADACARAGRPLPESSDCAPAAAAVLTVAVRSAPYLATLLARDGGRLWRVAASPHLHREKPADTFMSDIRTLVGDCEDGDHDEFRRRLRVFRGDEIVRLGVREIELANPADVGRELAHLADAAFEAAIEFHDRELRARYGPPRYVPEGSANGDDLRDAELVVIGMGKLGGEELNFSSDVDVIYVYSSDAGAAGELTLHEYYAKLCKLVTATIGEVTAEDVVFRVDLRLRPEGSQGAIANSLPSIERYYETWGRPWERQAWLKARPCAGSQALGREVMATLRPFVYPRITSAVVVSEVSELNRRIKAELDRAGIEAGFDLKNGVGGIREVEFFVQALQLIHAGRIPAVRSRTTLIALDQLLFAGLVTEREHRALAEAYRFLRHAEHMLQLDSGRQTQRLPARPDDLDRFARRMGLPGADELACELSRHTGEVARLFATLGEDEDGPRVEIAALLYGGLPVERERELCARLGFRDPARAQRLVDAARGKPASPLGATATGAAARVGPELLYEICTCPDPDQALGYLVELIARRGAWAPIWRLFGENPAIMRLVASLFGASEFLGKRFVLNPDLIDVLLEVVLAPPARTRQELLRTLGPMTEPDDESGESEGDADDEALWNRLAEFKNTELLRIGLADVGGELDASAVSRELSALAEVCLQRGFDIVARAMRARHGVPREPDGTEAAMAVLALGKLGGRELGYASDLDVVFVYSADGVSDGARPVDNVTYMTRLAQRLMGGLHALHPGGRLYEIDTRLRPSGSQGLLVSSLAAWTRYHDGDARLWEQQALTRLRPVAGDAALGERVVQVGAEFVYGRAPGEGGRPERAVIAAEIAAMREKIERELAGASGTRDLKTGPGGLIDIEFAAQYLRLAHGHAHPAVRATSTVAALRAAADAGVHPRQDCELLIDGYRFLRTLEHRMRIVHDRSVHRLPDDVDELDVLARRAGYPDVESLVRDYAQTTLDVRAAYLRVLTAA